MANKQKTAIVLTQVYNRASPKDTFLTALIALPVSRIAKVEQSRPDMRLAADNASPVNAAIWLRTPEDFLRVTETVEQVTALMNGDPA